MKVQHIVLFDSDANPIAAYPVGDDDTPVNLGCAIVEHWHQVDRTPGADEPHLTLKREMIGPDNEWYGGPRVGDDECETAAAPRCGTINLARRTTCQEPATWNIAARDADGQYSRAQSTCDQHLAGRLREFYDACIVDEETAAQVRPYDRTLREPLD